MEGGKGKGEGEPFGSAAGLVSAARIENLMAFRIAEEKIFQLVKRVG